MSEDMGWVHTSMERVHEKMDSVLSSMTVVREDIAAIKASDAAGKVAALEARVKLLEERENQRTGAVKFSEALYKLAPWLFLTAYVVFTSLKLPNF